jgi:hypothetical protein
LIECVLEGKTFPVATVANGDVHRAPAVGLVVIDPRLVQFNKDTILISKTAVGP